MGSGRNHPFLVGEYRAHPRHVLWRNAYSRNQVGSIAPGRIAPLAAIFAGWAAFCLPHSQWITEYRGLYLGSLDGKTKKLLIPIDSAAAYLRSGYLLYNDGDMLLAQPFDVGRLTLDGPPFAVAERVGHGSQSDGAFSASDAGTIAYAGPILHMGHLRWFDREGKELGSATEEGDYTDFRLSPDERQLAASRVDPKTGSIDIWLTDSHATVRLALHSGSLQTHRTTGARRLSGHRTASRSLSAELASAWRKST